MRQIFLTHRSVSRVSIDTRSSKSVSNESKYKWELQHLVFLSLSINRILTIVFDFNDYFIYDRSRVGKIDFFRSSIILIGNDIVKQMVKIHFISKIVSVFFLSLSIYIILTVFFSSLFFTTHIFLSILMLTHEQTHVDIKILFFFYIYMRVISSSTSCFFFPLLIVDTLLLIK